MPSEYEDKYLLLRDENTALKKKKNEQEATIKRMYTKLAIIEEKLTKKRQNQDKNNQDDPETGGNSNKAGVVPVRRDLDTEKFIAALKNENVTLRKKNQSLMERNRWLEEQCRQTSSLKRLGGAAASTTRPSKQKRPVARSIAARNEGFAGSTLEKQTESARNLHRDTFSGDLEVALKKRLVIAEKQLAKLQKDNEQLRANSSHLVLKSRRGNNEESGPSDEEEEDKAANNRDPTTLEIDQLKRELRDRQAQLAILNARYENLESNALAEREIQEKTLGQMEQMNRQVHKLRTQLQDAVMEKEEMEIRMMKAGDHEKDIALLRDQNRRLEERMTSLCESPFINDAFQRKERIDKLFDLEKLTQEQKATITHMTEENQKLQGVIRELQSSIKQLKQAKDRVEQDLEQMAHHLMEERNARSLEVIKSTAGSVPVPRPEPLAIIRPRTPETKQQLPEKRDACSSPVNNNSSPPKNSAPTQPIAGSVVGRKYGELPTSAGFLDVTMTEEDNSVKHLRNRVHVLQIAHLKSMQELERCEKMLQAQTNINRELALEIEELTTSKISSSNQLQRRMKELELLSEERQQRIHFLQAEIKQLKYAREKLLLNARNDDDVSSDDSSSDDERSEVASLSESLILAARDLAPGEQLLELGIMSGNFDSNIVGINSSTFVLCDFYDFESQSTPLLMGSRPDYNLSATFKVTVDGFFLRYMASESVVLEVHQAVRGDFKLIGKASVRLSKLLQSKGVVKEPLLPVKSLASDDVGVSVLGSLNVVLRLSTPVSEIWQMHLRSYPQDIQLVSCAGKSSNQEVPTDVLCGEDDMDQCMNELQVTVFGCRKLRSYGKRADKSASRVPSSYVHYQLLGFPDVFTNIVPESSSPEYDLYCSRQAFALAVDACLLRFFSKCRLWMTVFDDQVDLDESAQEDGMVGKCGLLLSDLVNGENIRGWFPLKDQNGQYAGDISVLIQWKDPFQVLQLTSSQRARGVDGRPIDLHSLDFDQQHALLAMFSSDLDGRVNYRQFLHYASPSEELELLVAKLKERFEYAIDSEIVSSVQDALITEADVSQCKRMNISMKKILQAGEKYGMFLSDTERRLLLTTFGVADASSKCTGSVKDTAQISIGNDELIALNHLLLHINPRLSCAERLLSHKIRHTMRGYVQEQRKRKAADSVPAQKLFEKFDEDKCGRVTRTTFRKCLSAMGFDLMSVESEYRELVRNHTKQIGSDNIQSDHIGTDVASSSPDDIDLDEDVVEDVANKVGHQVKPSVGLHRDIEAKMKRPVVKREVSVMDTTELIASVAPAATEFQRRKQAFIDRMKAIASTSSKNLVYEQVEKKRQNQRLQKREEGAKPMPRQDLLQQQLNRLHSSQTIHHDAAKTLQRQYRQYKELQQQRCETNQAMTTVMEADVQLQRILSKWTYADLNNLESSMLAEIERDVPDARRTKLITKKQLGYMLTKMPRIALSPELLWLLTGYFSVKQSGMVAYRPLINFICSTSTEENEREKKKRMSVLSRLLFDIGFASHTFVSAGDMNETGVISFKKFHEVLTRLGVQLSPKEFHLITIMFDANGYEILYHSLLHTLSKLPHCQQLAKALTQCHRFGISSLREKILTFVNSDDGRLTQEELLRVLMQQSAETVSFEPKDASLLFQMIAGTNDGTKRISIQELCLRIETATKFNQKSLSDAWNKYEMHHLQHLAWNCRKLLCGSYPDMKDAFERFDWEEKGIVSLVEFVAIAHRIGFVLFADNQLKGIAKRFGVKTSGSFGINYRQFLDWTTPPPPVDMDVVEEKLRNFAKIQASRLPSRQLSEAIANWNQIFSTEATDGTLSRSHFVKICKSRLGLPLDDNEMQALLYAYDPRLVDQIDCGAFLRMNWREATIATQKRVETIDDIAKAKFIVENISEKLRERKGIAKDIADAFSFINDTSDQFVECGPFYLAMRKLGISISPDEAQTLFSVFAEQPDKRKLDFVKFFKNSFSLQVTNASTTIPDYRLSSENETRLKCALEAAVRFSLPKLQKSFVQFQEFCVVHQFGEIIPSKLWRQMDANGLVELLSKRGAGLLSQKFSVLSNDDDDEEGDTKFKISLKAVHTYLKDFLKNAPAAVQRSSMDSSAMPKAVPEAQPKLSRTPITILSELMVWCDEHGIDLRGEMEANDNTYTGFVTAMELKQTLLRLGIAKFALPSSTEAVIGQLVRQFRSTEQTDAVHYVEMLRDATKLLYTSPDSRWYDQISEHLRSRIRLKANFSGKIDHSDPTNYVMLDTTFNHFDRGNKGFLTAEALQVGLRALQYELTTEQLNVLMTQMCIFRHAGGGLSRTEFDSFVLDPYGCGLLKKLSDQLYSEVEPNRQDTMPRIAYLSRLLMECGGLHCQSSLPKGTFWTQLEQALEREVTEWERLRLQHLFDMDRDGQIAYKLFLKVMSQWRTPVNTVTSVPPRDGKMAEQRPVTKPEKQLRIQENSKSDNKPTCACDAILRSLYNQMSSIDFDSQVDIVEEYLRLKDRKHTGSIKMKQLKKVFDQIGLSLSADAFTSLQMYFPGIASSSAKEEQGELVAYEKLLLALEVIHEEKSDKSK